MSEARSWRGRGRRRGVYESEPYAARAETVTETLGADGTPVRTGEGRAQAPGAHSAAGWGFASRVVGGLGSAGCFWGEDHLPGSRASPRDTKALAPHVLFCVATADPGSWLRWHWPGGPVPRRSPASSPGQTHFVARGKGTAVFLETEAGPRKRLPSSPLVPTAPLPASEVGAGLPASLGLTGHSVPFFLSEPVGH